jgi:hypothetical protein
VTAAEVDERIEQQAGLCSICLRSLGKTPHVDHDHETGAIRGVLCFNCNGGLGQFRDDPDLLLRAADYLEEHALCQGEDDLTPWSQPPRTWRTPVERLAMLFPPKAAG